MSENNIYFTLEEKEHIDDRVELFNLMSELDQPYINYDTYENYTVKDLLKICSYYGIDKNIKSAKCKKQDIIFNLVYFESLFENAEIVQKRQESWNSIYILLNDPKMKKYILWN
jgi:hypothetical protein